MKPDYWTPNFGNDWLVDLFEIELDQVGALQLFTIEPALAWTLIGFAAYCLSRGYVRLKIWQAEAYKREAKLILRRISNNRNYEDINSLLKRCGLQLLGRDEVANLSGRHWRTCLNSLGVAVKKSPASLFSISEIDQIEAWSYAPLDKSSSIEASRIINKVSAWIDALPAAITPQAELVSG